jgi:hypothetical protein
MRQDFGRRLGLADLHPLTAQICLADPRRRYDVALQDGIRDDPSENMPGLVIQFQRFSQIAQFLMQPSVADDSSHAFVVFERY